MHICGVDEAGRGPLAGPVTAAAVVLSEGFPVHVLNDSKRLSPGERSSAAGLILEHAADYSIGWAWPEEIDSINILQASLLAMRRALDEMTLRPDLVLVDGLYVPEYACECYAIVRGDGAVPEIMAASILAKVARDRWMIRYSWIDGRYGFERHKGYPTEEHRTLCRMHGPSEIHRKTFRGGS